MRVLVSMLVLIPLLIPCLILTTPEPAQASTCEPTGAIESRGELRSAVRSVEDPALGKTWELHMDCAHPAGPGKLVEVNQTVAGTTKSRYVTRTVTNMEPVNIHVGEMITLVEDTLSVHLALQAVALEAGIQGRRIRVRLLNGGAILSASVLGPGRVGLLPKIEPFEKTNERLP